MKNDQLRTINQNIYRRLIFFGLISVVSVMAGYLAIMYWWFPGFARGISETNNWNLLEGFVGAISLALLAGGLTFALAEYIDTEKAKQAEKAKLSYEIYNAIYGKLTDPAQEAARRWILSNIAIKRDDEDIETWYQRTHAKIMKTSRGGKGELPEGQNAIKLTLNCFDYIGFIADHYWDMEDDSLDWISAPIAKVWRRIGPYVLHVRALRKTTDYYLSAERVGELCVEWRQGKGLPDEEIAKETP